jgi:UPF0755 protein
MVFSSPAKLWTKIWIFAGILFLGLVFIGIFLPYDRKSSAEIVFSIAKGEGSREIGYNLQTQGLIRFSPLFRIYVATTGVSLKLQAGDYLLSPAMSMFDIVRKLTTGDVIQEKFTIVEGWNIQDIKDYFATKGRIIEISPDLEGYLFPDTYHIGNNASTEEIIAMMRENFEKKFSNDLKQETVRQGKTTAQIVIMASLLEKEVQTLEDKKTVAGILWKRLSIGMALQVDATIAYLTGKRTTQISREETQIDSRFNTYKYAGLPAGPIANPGLDSLEASLYPQDSPYWYYLSTPEGKTIFSKTLEEHNVAKAKYLKN